MQLTTDVLLWCLGIVGVIGFRRRGEKQYLVPAIVGFTVPLLNLVHLPRVAIEFGAVDALLLVLVLLLVADVQGLPAPVARRTGYGIRSHQWEFDRRFHDYRADLDRLMLSYPAQPDWPSYRRWKADLLRRGPKLIARMRSLREPDGAWGDIRDEYVNLYEEILARVANDEYPDDNYSQRRGTELKQRADALRLRYRTEVRAAASRK